MVPNQVRCQLRHIPIAGPNGPADRKDIQKFINIKLPGALRHVPSPPKIYFGITIITAIFALAFPARKTNFSPVR